MLNFFNAGQEIVTWDLQVVQGNPYQVRLTMHHALGSIVEYFETDAAALARQKGLEELLVSARGFGQAPAAQSSGSAEQPSPTTRKGSLLIVDDDVAVTQTFSRMLALEGHSVRTANSAEAGLREAESGHFDAIILDLRMPIVDGLGFLRRLRTTSAAATPAVIVTGDYFLDDALAKEIASLGAEIRFKPLWLEDLVELARTLLSPSRRPAVSAFVS
jgi:CheY-like chemotaxis protein